MPFKLTSSAIFLILANVVPIFGVLYWGWDATAILVLYWLESVIMGLLNVPKILACRQTEGPLDDGRITLRWDDLLDGGHIFN